MAGLDKKKREKSSRGLIKQSDLILSNTPNS